MATENVTEQVVAAHSIPVAEKIEYPSVKYNPLRYIEIGEKVRITIEFQALGQQDYSVIKQYKYEPSIEIPESEGRLFECKLAIVKTTKPIED